MENAIDQTRVGFVMHDARDFDINVDVGDQAAAVGSPTIWLLSLEELRTGLWGQLMQLEHDAFAHMMCNSYGKEWRTAICFMMKQ